MDNLININDIDISEPFSDSIKVYKTHHIKIKNDSNFTIKFQITYTLNSKLNSLDSGNFFSKYTRQLSFPIGASSVFLIIKSVNSSNEEYDIYCESVENKNYSFIITGNLNKPIISKGE